jgi:ankyrin repeat protein
VKDHSLSPTVLLTICCLCAGCAGITTPSRHQTLDYTPIDAAVEAGDLNAVKALIKQDPRLVNVKGWGDSTPLHLAALNDRTEIATFLLAQKADVNAKTTKEATALHFAAQRNNRQLAVILLAHGADINAVDASGWTPADRAVKWKHLEMSDFLKKHRGRSNLTFQIIR